MIANTFYLIIRLCTNLFGRLISVKQPSTTPKFQFCKIAFIHVVAGVYITYFFKAVQKEELGFRRGGLN